MASVACCPKCRHELLIPDGVDINAWAQCYSCNVLFQVCDAAPREVTPAVMLAPGADLPAAPLTPASAKADPLATIALSSEQTIGEIPPAGDASQFAANEPDSAYSCQPLSATARSAATIADLSPNSAATLVVESEEAAHGTSAETSNRTASYDALTTIVDPLPSIPTFETALAKSDPLPPEPVEVVVPLADHDEVTEVDADPLPTAPSPDSEPTPTAHDISATVDLEGFALAEGADIDIELDHQEEPAVHSPRPTWDDSEHMDQLLGNADGQAANVTVASELDAPESAAEFENSGPAEPPVNELAALLSKPIPGRRRRRSSVLRTLVGIAASGVIGTAIGYYVLLAWLGPGGDVLDVARHLPSAVLPDSFSATPSESADARTPPADANDFVDQARFEAPSTGGDPAVAPAEFAGDSTALSAGPEPGLKAAPPLTATDLEIALRAAKQAQSGLMTGDLSDAAVRRIKGDSFETLCRLAEVTTLIQSSPGVADLTQLQGEAAALFRDTLADVRIRGEVARIVPVWIASPHRTNQGVFLAGTLTRQSSGRPVAEFQLDSGVSSGERLIILMPETLASTVGESNRSVGVVGAIIDRPSEHISGYTGDVAQAVWVSQVVTLD